MRSKYAFSAQMLAVSAKVSLFESVHAVKARRPFCMFQTMHVSDEDLGILKQNGALA